VKRILIQNNIIVEVIKLLVNLYNLS